MIQEDEYIIYISQAKCAVTIKETESLKTGMLQKKLVITTRRCLFFESLSNQVQEIEFQIMRKKKNPQDDKKKQSQAKKRMSINQFPQNSFPINDRKSKIMIDEEPTCHKYLQKIGLLNYVKSVSGIVILKNVPKMKFQLLAFPSLKDGFRFCKALICAKAWISYQNYCQSFKIPINKMWVRIITEVANNEKSVVLIDPDLFLSGSREEIKSFLVLINQIPFAHSFEHRYSITNQQIVAYSTDLIQTFQEKTHSLIMRYNNMTVINMNAVFTSRIKLQHLMHLDLSHNKFTDEVFVILQKMSKEGKRLSYFNLSYNLINLRNGTFFVNFLKTTQIILTIDLTYNELDDACIDTMQKFMILPHNPPVQQLDISNNKFTKKGSWRLFIGNNRAHKYHPYLNFVIYPIPVTPDIFPPTAIDYPTPLPLINFNIHSALVQQFEQESFLKHTLQQVLKPNGTIIRLIRRLPKDVKLPRSKQEVRNTLQLANKIQNFLYSPQFVENMYDLAEEVAKFEFNLPPVSKMHFVRYLSDKLNEALFIRDHYSVKHILKAFIVMGVDYQGYKPRVDKVNARNAIVNKKIENIMNFEIDQYQINKQLDEIVREGLRLYLTGNGIQSIYYLKYLRDKWIQRLLHQKYNPQHYIHQKMADKNMNMDDEITQKQLVVPYQIRVEKKINQNFYLHPWKTNYFVLSQILRVQYEECLKFLEESSKREKFAIYFQRIQERIQFMRNQFNLFSYDKFKCSYSDLKINCARLLAMYRFISQKNYYLQIPAIARKKQINKQKNITIQNQTRFKLEYDISKYHNINIKSKRARFFNYTEGKMTKYSSEIFHQEYIKFKVIMDALFKILEKQSSTNSFRIPEEIIAKIIQIIKFLNQSIYPIQLKQQFYLRILSWRNGKHMTNTQILQYMPFLSMYIRPPLAMEKYIVAAILNDDKLNIGQLPLSIVTDVNKTTEANVQQVEKNYVERDWLANQKILVRLMKSNGKVSIDVQLLTKNTISLNIPQSKTVDEVVSNLISLAKDVEDVSHFWLYMGYVGDSNLVVLEECQHIGQILYDKQEKQKYFLFKRRIFCPEWKYIYRKYSETIINSLYYDIKAEYLLGQFFINDREMLNLAATMFIVDLVDKVTPKESFPQLLNNRLKNLGNYYRQYMPAQAISRSMKIPSELINQFRDKINEKVLKKENLKPLQCKKQILNLFEDYPQFLCSNYIFMDRNKLAVKVSINLLNIYINSQQEIEKFGFEKIISIIPKTKFLLINYHKHEGVIGKVSLFGDENKILSTAQDILAYCMIRVKMLSPSLYSAFRYEFLMEKHIKIKEPTKDKQMLDTIRRIKKRLATSSPTILEESAVPYFQSCRYIKMRTPRKLYANASLEKLDIVQDRPQDYQLQKEVMRRKKDPNDSTVDRHNVFRTILPNVMKQEEGYENLDEQFPSYMGRSVSEPYDLSAYHNIDESIISRNPDNEPSIANEPGKQPPKSPIKTAIKEPINQPIKQLVNEDEPPQLTPIKNKEPMPDEDFGTITTAQRNRSNRLPPKRNR